MKKLLSIALLSTLFFSFISNENYTSPKSFGEIRKMGLDSITYAEATLLHNTFKTANPNQLHTVYLSKSIFNHLTYEDDGFMFYFTFKNNKMGYVLSPAKEFVENKDTRYIERHIKMGYLAGLKTQTVNYNFPEHNNKIDSIRRDIRRFKNQFSQANKRGFFIGRDVLYNMVYKECANCIGLAVFFAKTTVLENTMASADEPNNINIILKGSNTETPNFANYANTTFFRTSCQVRRIPRLPDGIIGAPGGSCVKPCPDSCGDL